MLAAATLLEADMTDSVQVKVLELSDVHGLAQSQEPSQARPF